MATQKVTKWYPMQMFDDETNESHHNDGTTAFIILNQPINERNDKLFKKLWSRSVIRLCADGATNQLYEWASKHNCLHEYIPDYICGDLDSIDDNVKSFYEKSGKTTIVQILNQDSTDFTKTIEFTIKSIRDNCYTNANYDQVDSETLEKLSKRCKRIDTIKNIYVFCNSTGRFDHIMANLHTLHQVNNINQTNNHNADVYVYLIGEDSLTFLLNSGDNYIYGLKNNKLLDKYCGFFPLSQPTIVTTNGLKWNINKQLCSFNGLISSSNEYSIDNDKDYVFIQSEHPIIWNMSIK